MKAALLHIAILILVLVFWGFMSLSPIDIKDFWLESALLLILLTILSFTYKKFKFSTTSYILIALFLGLHSIGAHYTYSNVPFGFWMQDALSLNRNMFDRIVHFSFGLLLTYPIFELLKRTTKLSGFWLYYIPIDIVLATSGLFEIIEMFVAINVSPELGAEYLGMQGDIWDAQKDMLCATIGSLITIFFTAITLKYRKISK